MKTFHLTRTLQFTKIGCALITLAALTACAALNSFFKTVDSTLPIETLDSTGGEVSSARAFESADRLFVWGHIRKSFGRHIPYAAHVDVQLVDTIGRMIAEKQEDINPTRSKLSGGISGRISYVASFPLSDARQAAKITVRYHLDGHTS